MSGRPDRQFLPFQHVAAFLVWLDETDPQELSREPEKDIIHDLGDLVDLPGRHAADIPGQDRNGFFMLLLQGRELNVAHVRVLFVKPALDHDVGGHPRELEDHALVPERDEGSQRIEPVDQREPLDVFPDLFAVARLGPLVGNGHETLSRRGAEQTDQVAALVGNHVMDEGIVFVAVEQHVGGRGTAGHPDPGKGLQVRLADEQHIPARDISQGVKDGADRFGEPLDHGSVISQSLPGINHRLMKP